MAFSYENFLKALVRKKIVYKLLFRTVSDVVGFRLNFLLLDPLFNSVKISTGAFMEFTEYILVYILFMEYLIPDN